MMPSTDEPQLNIEPEGAAGRLNPLPSPQTMNLTTTGAERMYSPLMGGTATLQQVSFTGIMSSRLIAQLVHCDPVCLCCTEQQRLFCSFLSAVKVSAFDTPHGATAVYSPAAKGGVTRSWWPHVFPSQGSCQADSSHSWYVVTQGVSVAQAVLRRSALHAFGVQGFGL